METMWCTHFVIYLLPKKRKCSITSHTEMYCLRKKNIFIYFFRFFHFFSFSETHSVSIILHQKKKSFPFSDMNISCFHVPTTFSTDFFLFCCFFVVFFVCLFLKMHKEIHNSQLPFWFYKLIQSHMCYTGLELEHCKLYSWILLFSIVGYKKEQAT